ncbi:MAG: acyl-CoA reductase [Bacteroidetes bacterium]|nr:acyl-CoA reductase [Bacteroidota bacterium]
MLDLKKRQSAFIELGNYLQTPDMALEGAIHKAFIYNAWFEPINTKQYLLSIASAFLSQSNLEKWTSNYNISKNLSNKNIGIIAAGNIPIICFHDVLCVLISGHKAQIKLSDKDKYLLPFILNKLIEIEPAFENQIQIVERIVQPDAIIATGSDNTGRYFEHYFGKYPNIIRKNRHSIAILEGNETDEELLALGNDIFDYFGMGCRNVSQLLIPKDFDLTKFKTIWEPFKDIMEHNKYRNNLDYQRTVYLMSIKPMVDIDFINIVDNDSLGSPIACLHLKRYENKKEIDEFIESNKMQLQCIVGKDYTPFGKSQMPQLWDYADNIDTMKFLVDLY